MRTNLKRMLMVALPLAGMLSTATVALARDHHEYPARYYRHHEYRRHNRDWRPYAYEHRRDRYERDWRGPDRYSYAQPYSGWYREHRHHDD
jgi:hypothetical protein